MGDVKLLWGKLKILVVEFSNVLPVMSVSRKSWLLHATAHTSDKYCTQCPFTAFYLPSSDFSRKKLKKARAKSVQVINVTRLEKLLKGHLSFSSLKDLQKLSSDDICPGTSVNISQDKSNSKKKNKGWSGSLERKHVSKLCSWTHPQVFSHCPHDKSINLVLSLSQWVSTSFLIGSRGWEGAAKVRRKHWNKSWPNFKSIKKLSAIVSSQVGQFTGLTTLQRSNLIRILRVELSFKWSPRNFGQSGMCIILLLAWVPRNSVNMCICWSQKDWPSPFGRRNVKDLQKITSGMRKWKISEISGNNKICNYRHPAAMPSNECCWPPAFLLSLPCC